MDAPVFKLYVSPTPDALAGDGFATIVAALCATRAWQFKLGADAPHLLRPDKLVAYFPDFETLTQAASEVQKRLAGMAAHGVPFTAEIADGGLLSWGVDPPRTNGFGWTPGESWRLWVTRRLAQAIVQARDADQPWRFAMERLRLEGINPESWTPDSAIFSER